MNIELALTNMIVSVSDKLSSSVVLHLHTLARAGELSLCFEELCAYLGEFNVCLKHDQYDSLATLGEMLHVDSDWWTPLRPL
jgi:hypothetical protein